MKDNIEEEWRDIEGYEGRYEISNLGRVRSLFFKAPKFLRQGEDSWGYKQVVLSKNGLSKNFKVHRLVMLHFSKGEVTNSINHIDGNKSNNSIQNLEWSSASKNNKHAYANGLMSSRKRPRLNPKQIKSIYRLCENKELTKKQIANKFNVSLNTVHRIHRRETWKDIDVE